MCLFWTQLPHRYKVGAQQTSTDGQELAKMQHTVYIYLMNAQTYWMSFLSAIV